LHEGSVLVPSLTSTWRRARLAGRRWVQGTPALNQLWSRVKPLREKLSGRRADAVTQTPP
jgi:hypothetical protein